MPEKLRQFFQSEMRYDRQGKARRRRIDKGKLDLYGGVERIRRFVPTTRILPLRKRTRPITRNGCRTFRPHATLAELFVAVDNPVGPFNSATDHILTLTAGISFRNPFIRSGITVSI